MNWQDYKEVDSCRYGGIGILKGDYVCTIKLQAQMLTQFRYISREEFDSFPQWKDDKDTWEKLRLRTTQWQGYYLSSEFQKCGEGYYHVKKESNEIVR